MGKIIVFGDDHVRSEEPFYSAKKDFFDWCVSQPWNTNENYMVHVGDLFHYNEPLPKDYDLVFSFLNKLKFKKIYIMAGNGAHEYNRSKKSYAIDPLAQIEKVELIREPREILIGNTLNLFLPWIPSKLIEGKTMKEYYENYKDPEEKWEYIFGHFAHKPFFGTEINIDYLDGEKRMGHIHIPDGEYVGVNTITRSDEKGIDCKLNCIDTDTAEETFISIPKFLDYEDVKYPEAPKYTAKYTIVNVFEAPSQELALAKYEYVNTIHLKNKREFVATENSNVDKKPINELFTSFCNLKKIKKPIQEIIINAGV